MYTIMIKQYSNYIFISKKYKINYKPYIIKSKNIFKKKK